MFIKIEKGIYQEYEEWMQKKNEANSQKLIAPFPQYQHPFLPFSGPHPGGTPSLGH